MSFQFPKRTVQIGTLSVVAGLIALLIGLLASDETCKWSVPSNCCDYGPDSGQDDLSDNQLFCALCTTNTPAGCDYSSNCINQAEYCCNNGYSRCQQTPYGGLFYICGPEGNGFGFTTQLTPSCGPNIARAFFMYVFAIAAGVGFLIFALMLRSANSQPNEYHYLPPLPLPSQ